LALDRTGPLALFQSDNDGMAAESTEKHGNNQYPLEFFRCPSVDSVANEKKEASQPDLSASVIVKLK
jgi:hypothetical protein